MNVTFCMLGYDELYSRLVNYNARRPYRKLDSAIEKIKYFNPGYEQESGGAKFYYFCAFHKDTLVGVAKLKTGGTASLSNTGWENWIGYVSVRENWFGHGIGKQILRNLFNFCAERNLKVLMSGYSVRGWFHLRQAAHDISTELGVEICDNATEPTFYDWEACEGYNQAEYENISKCFYEAKRKAC